MAATLPPVDTPLWHEAHVLSPGAPVLPADGCGTAIIKSGRKRFILSPFVDWFLIRAPRCTRSGAGRFCAFRREVPRVAVELLGLRALVADAPARVSYVNKGWGVRVPCLGCHGSGCVVFPGSLTPGQVQVVLTRVSAFDAARRRSGVPRSRCEWNKLR